MACLSNDTSAVDALMEHDPTLYERTPHPGGLLAFEEAVMIGNPTLVKVLYYLPHNSHCILTFAAQLVLCANNLYSRILSLLPLSAPDNSLS